MHDQISAFIKISELLMLIDNVAVLDVSERLNQVCDWFEPYPNDRQTLLNYTMSSDLFNEDVYDVPQDSVLGPLLFPLYIDDIKSVIQNAYCHLVLIIGGTKKLRLFSLGIRHISRSLTTKLKKIKSNISE